MPPFDLNTELPKKSKAIKSAYDSESFDADGSIHVDGFSGSATISTSGRDVALASLVHHLGRPRRLRTLLTCMKGPMVWLSLIWTHHTTRRVDCEVTAFLGSWSTFSGLHSRSETIGLPPPQTTGF
jgi:hypothetical protein